LPAEQTDDWTRIKKQYRKISLSVHPDKNKHPQADAAFRKVYGAFETLSDPVQQRRLLFELGLGFAATEKEKEFFENAGAEDEDDMQFQWWWEASVPDVEKAAEEAEGAEMDSYAASWVSDGLGGDVKDVRWIGLKKAIGLHEQSSAIFIDCREREDYLLGGIPGAYHVPMSAVMRYGLIEVMGQGLIHAILSTERHALIIVYSQVATPFSRCRAMCRWLLRAGHQSLPALRFRRLRGGVFGWTHQGGTVIRPLAQPGAPDDLDERLKRAQDLAEKAEQHAEKNKINID
jgi:rhodanese-related sulfurtransferase